jgi:predicted SnoaL-like aldol condensation-catalyzing enzyme
MTREEWLEAYGLAWEEGDSEAAASLFTENAIYCSHPFREPHVGREGILAYWTEATSTQSDVSVRFGAPVAAGDRLSVEWWATFRDEGEEVTLPGILLLRFAPDGRCEELREYWHTEGGLREPFAGWGR